MKLSDDEKKKCSGFLDHQMCQRVQVNHHMMLGGNGYQTEK